MKQVLEVRGKAKQVFKYMELLSRHKGNVTLKDLAKHGKTVKVELR